MPQTEWINIVEDLIETCKDGEKGYQDAAEHVKDQQLKALFLERSMERNKFLRDLESELTGFGRAPKKESGSVGAATHRAWMDLKANLGGGDKTILASIEQGEDKAKEVYQKAIQSSLPSELQTVIRNQANSIMRAHDEIKSLRDLRAA